jgi:TLC domain
VILAISALCSQPVWGFASPNSSSENRVLEFSVAYFTMDLIHYLIFTPQEYLFIAHHLATLFVFITCLCVALHGAFSLVVLLVFAEVTSLCQNIWTLAGLRKGDSDLARRVYWGLSPPFYALYTVMRVIVGPLFFVKMSTSVLKREARDVMPIWISLSWIVVVGAAIMVSWLWIWNNWMEYFRERSVNKEKKEG